MCPSYFANGYGGPSKSKMSVPLFGPSADLWCQSVANCMVKDLSSSVRTPVFLSIFFMTNLLTPHVLLLSCSLLKSPRVPFSSFTRSSRHPTTSGSLPSSKFLNDPCFISVLCLPTTSSHLQKPPSRHSQTFLILSSFSLASNQPSIK